MQVFLGMELYIFDKISATRLLKTAVYILVID